MAEANAGIGLTSERRFDVWMRDPNRWDFCEGRYVGFNLHYASLTLRELLETLAMTAYWDVAVVEAGITPFTQDPSTGRWQREPSVLMVAECLQALWVDPDQARMLEALLTRCGRLH
jgi:hypothetical protein